MRSKFIRICDTFFCVENFRSKMNTFLVVIILEKKRKKKRKKKEKEKEKK
ncbi:hypothetical protein HanRHA438_Chr10g0461771 [Helianthus annuus]|nr:hypothetical protein HanRHA438_Chr10g0461771 [Helianthus annuus]